jgi:hypothetical protein
MPSIFKFLNIDTVRNLLLCSTNLVGIGELVEIHAPDDETPRQAGGKILKKLKDPNLFVPQIGEDGNSYLIGERSILRIVGRNRSGSMRRKFSPDEKLIVNLEKNEAFKEKRIVRAKTGSVRKKKKSH